MRTEIVKNCTKKNIPNIIVTYPGAIFEKITTGSEIKNKFLKV